MSDAIRIDRGTNPVEPPTADAERTADESVSEELASEDAVPEGGEEGEAVPGDGTGHTRLKRRRRRKSKSLSSTKAMEKGRKRAIVALVAVIVLFMASGYYVYWASDKLEKLRAATSWDKKKIDEKLNRLEELSKGVLIRTTDILDLEDGQAASRGLHIDDGGTLTLRIHVPITGPTSEWDLLLQGGSKGVKELGRMQARSRDTGIITLNVANLSPGSYELQGTRSGDTRIYHFAFEIR